MTSDSERRVEILRFVQEREHSGQNTTKAIVARYLREQKKSSSETTHNIIRELVDEGKLNKKEINSQVHFLTINEANEYNRIYRQLSEIELIIFRMLENIAILHEKKPEDTRKHEGPWDSLAHVQDINYPMMIDFMLHILLAQVNKEIKSEIDRQILYPRVITLMDIMSKHPLSITSLPLIEEYIDYTTKIISKNSIINYARETGIKLTPIHELLSKTEEFKKELLIQIKQKPEEPHEKSSR